MADVKKVLTEEQMNAKVAEYKEYQQLKKDLEAQMELLKVDMIAFLEAENTDDYLCNEGHVIFRDKVSNRFDSTAFKQSEWAELYKEFTKPQTTKPFIVN